MKPLDFIANIKDGAQETMLQYGVLTSLTMAQAALESGWGVHTYDANNLFGIKANGWTNDKCKLITTTEEENGQTITIKAYFRSYGSFAESVKDHGLFIASNKRYLNIIGNTNYKTVCRLIKADGYATESSYANELISLIEQYKMQQYDAIPSKMCIDIPKDESIHKGILSIGGWGICKAGVKRFDVYADGKKGLASISILTNRPDVNKAWNKFGYYKNATKSGFCVGIKTSELSSGKHSIDIAMIGNDKSVMWKSVNIYIQ